MVALFTRRFLSSCESGLSFFPTCISVCVPSQVYMEALKAAKLDRRAHCALEAYAQSSKCRTSRDSSVSYAAITFDVEA